MTDLLKKHEEILNLREQKEAIQSLMKVNQHLTFQTDLQGRQLAAVERRLEQIGEITDEEALSLLEDDEQEFKKYLNFTSIKYLKRLVSQSMRNYGKFWRWKKRRKRWRRFIPI